ncbi:division abnormally delayed protein isoform X1 [Bombyx mori]|uniref:Division abnormally delayed protein n=2 Tax=Bombyx mori TaxID=7091 RepID=A0A8R2AKS2_BOMMO|nr:division abnormally delayed protein [Bombyx mori]
MRCFMVFLSVVAVVRAAAGAATSCAQSEAYFSRHNISAGDDQEPGQICGGQCCGRGREANLRAALRRTAEESIAISTVRTAELMLSTRRTLQEHLLGLSHRSQNKTAVLFTQLYRGHATRTHTPLATLYDDIRTLLRSSSEHDVITDIVNTRHPKDLVTSARKFFRDLFPVAYQNALRLDSKQFTPEYEACLKDAYDAVQPFGEVPQQLGVSLSQSLEAARVLLDMLAVGAGALTSANHVLAGINEECSNKLLQAAGCARCAGFDARPCRNYCLNIARGCIGSLLVELDGPWSSYVEGVEQLTRIDADVALRELDTKVSKAIMYALENRNILENKVRQECGPPSTVDSGLTPAPPTPGSVRRDDFRAPPPDTELLQFAATLASTKRLFSTVADRLCDETDFVDDVNEHCWNGQAIGEYSKPLVPSSTLSNQKYNPEITLNPPQDPRLLNIADRLQQARQLLISHAGTGGAQAEAFMQGDEAGEEGSGSGRSYPEDDGSYDAEGSGEEGSGSDDDVSRTMAGENRGGSATYSSTERTQAATNTRPFLSVIFATLILAAFGQCVT